jgi:hypothetical protein
LVCPGKFWSVPVGLVGSGGFWLMFWPENLCLNVSCTHFKTKFVI